MSLKVSRRPEYAVLARLIAEAREQSGLTQSALARKLGKRPAFIWKIEAAYQSPDLVELLDIAKVLHVDLPSLVAAFVTEAEKAS